MVKNMPAKQEVWVGSLVGKMPWKRKWQPSPVFLPGKSHGQRSLAGSKKRVRKDFVTKKQQNRIYIMDLWGGLDTVLRVWLSAQNVILVGATFVTTLGSLFGGI